MKSVALLLLLVCCLVAVVYGTPGKVIINGKCIDCNKPEDGDSVIIPDDDRKSAAVSQALTSGAVGFGIIYYLLSAFLRH